MIVLDTNVLSELMGEHAEPIVVRWLNRQPAPSVWTTTVSVYEIHYGLALLPAGRRRDRLTQEFEAILAEDLAGRVLNFDAASATSAAEVCASLRQSGQSIDVRDAFIAGTVAARRAVLATRNTKHFAKTGISLVDPWTDEA